MQFRGEQRALDAQQKPVVRVLRAVDAILVGNQRPEHRAELDDAVPVAVQARQARDLGDQHEADFAQADRGDQALEAGAHVTAGAGQAEVLVNDLDLRRWPAHLPRPLGELILPPGALLIGLHLPRRRLAHVDDGAQAQVARLDLGRDGIHGTALLARAPVPARPEAGAAAGLSRAGPGAGASRAGSCSTAAMAAGAGLDLGAWRASGARDGAPRKVATKAANARRLPGVNTSADTAATGGAATAGSVQRAGRSCRPPSRPSITR